MNTKTHHLENHFTRHLENAAVELPALEEEIAHIGGAAQSELHERLHNVEVMEQALRRNYAEVIKSEARPPARRVRNMRRLSRVIEKESNNLRREVGFLSMGSASTLISFAEGSFSALNSTFQFLKKRAPHWNRQVKISSHS